MNSVVDTDHLYRSYLRMAIPLVLGMAVSLIYNLADTFFIAQTNDVNLIAGVSVCAPVFTILMAFGNVFGQGGSSLISRMLGCDDKDGIARVSSFCFYISIIVGVVIAVVMTVFNKSFLSLLGATEETMSHALSYYSVLTISAPIIVLSFIHTNLVRCEGMSTESMIGTILGAVINIILDPILISVVGLGAMGAAVATVIGYGATVVYFLIVLRAKSRSLSVEPSVARVSAGELQQILGVGITAALSNLMTSIATIVLNQQLLPYGNDKIAAMGIVLKVNMIAILMLTGFAFGGVPVFGYLYGAHKNKELQKLLKFCLIFLGIISLVLTAFLCLLAFLLMSAFVADQELIATGAYMLRWQTITTVFASLVLLMTVFFQATGKIIPAFIMSISRQGVIFVAAVYVCVKLFAYDGLIISQAVADIISAVIAIILLIVCNPMKEE